MVEQIILLLDISSARVASVASGIVSELRLITKLQMPSLNALITTLPFIVLLRS